MVGKVFAAAHGQSLI